MTTNNNNQNKKLVYLESILLISDRALKIKDLAKKLNLEKKEIKKLIGELKKKFNTESSGIHLLTTNDKIQFTTNPLSEKIIKDFVKEELNSNLTDASLETLTIIAYRGPITRSELEQIRGVNCSVIIRNLLIKGLIENKTNREKMTKVYSITLDFLKYLGINAIHELPNYERLNSDKLINKIQETKLDD